MATNETQSLHVPRILSILAAVVIVLHVSRERKYKLSLDSAENKLALYLARNF